MTSPPLAPQILPPPDRRPWLLTCAAIFLTLLLWLLYWPSTGDGDAILHYYLAVDATHDGSLLIGAWARPIHKALIFLPAQFGLTHVRILQALLTTLLLWQTIRLAHEMGYRRPWLAALMLILQPYAFALGSDVMTEIPFALALVIAIRLWRSKHFTLSTLLVGFMPMIRPEGFLIGLLWALMLAFNPRVAPFRKRLLIGLTGFAGLLLWVTVSQLVTGRWDFVLRTWSWPAGSFADYPTGPIYWHVMLWPDYCGIVLIWLFLVGVYPASRRRGFDLLWSAWLVVFVTHSVLYWGHWFASFGLMRIMVTTSPVTALVCLDGWQTLSDWLTRHQVQRAARNAFAVAAILIATTYAFLRYAAEGDKHHCFPIADMVTHARHTGLADSAPVVFAGDRYFLAALNVHPTSRRGVFLQVGNKEATLNQLAQFPPGSIGMWDNRRAQVWYKLTPEELAALGYQVLATTRYDPPRLSNWFGTLVPGEWETQFQYILVRKTPTAPYSPPTPK